MAKVLFINPVIRESGKPAHVPYGLAQLAALAMREGHKVQVFDANAWRPSDKEIYAVLRADRWDVVATGGLVTTYGFIKKTVSIARKAAKNSLIVAGGGFITPIPHEVMGFLPEVDIGIVGEAYITLMEILKSVDAGEDDWSRVKGIIYRSPDGDLVLNRERELLEDVDSLPFPAWDIFPLDIYFQNSSLLLSEESMLAKRHIGVMASYGCPFRCKYCFHLGLSGELSTVESNGRRDVLITGRRKVRHHSPEYVVDLVRSAKKRFGIDFVSFYDENFVALCRNKDWFDEFSRRWLKSCRGIHWGATAHAAMVNENILRKLKGLGCSHLDYGLESFSDEVLLSAGKGSNSRINSRAVTMTMDAGIRPIPNQIIGFPDESFESIKADVLAWKKLGIRSNPFFATPYPGSEWYYSYKDLILKQYGGDLQLFLLSLGDAKDITCNISKNFNTVELLGLRELMVKGDLKRIEDYEETYLKTRGRTAR
ncbi:MAG: radical SAM protein [Candidatus Omnitrophica bacterium]|nr:radical SAM protein [Candidatus Omnitrophota bacterium]MDD5310566.1 radical SAM protein [Candidatus Omnitrophota bacterium]MDD5546008.1 radical SAM protein [Candidatus Omnitrophota bacterium]